MTYKTKLKKIFEKHGVSKQLKKLSEEVFELQEAIIDYTDFGFIDIVGYEKHIKEEFADVMVILNQIKEVLELNEDEIKDIMEFKIDRQCERDGIDVDKKSN